MTYKSLQELSSKQGLGQNTVATLARLSTSCGLALRPVSLKVDELLSCSRPLIVHMDGESPEVGAFLLIINIRGDMIDYLNGPSATLHSINLADFRRVWSGVALLPARNRWQGEFLFVAAFCAGLISAVVWRMIRLKYGHPIKLNASKTFSGTSPGKGGFAAGWLPAILLVLPTCCS